MTLEVCRTHFKDFLRAFRIDGVPVYLDLIEQIRATGNYNFALNCRHLAEFDENLYRNLVRYPQVRKKEKKTETTLFFFSCFPLFLSFSTGSYSNF